MFRAEWLWEWGQKLLSTLSLGHGDMAECTKNIRIINKSGAYCGAILRKMVRKLQYTNTQEQLLLLWQDQGEDMSLWYLVLQSPHENNAWPGLDLNHLCCHSQVCCQKTEEMKGHRHTSPTVNGSAYITTNIQ